MEYTEFIFGYVLGLTIDTIGAALMVNPLSGVGRHIGIVYIAHNLLRELFVIDDLDPNDQAQL